MLRFLLASGMVSLLLSSSALAATPSYDAAPQIKQYATLVHAAYAASHSDVAAMQKKVEDFLNAPGEKTLAAARTAWLAARPAYSQTEAFRFYEGPIDFVDEKNKQEGPEGYVNAWPLNEAHIDYVKGNAKAGIINDPSIPLNEAALRGKNQNQDEADVATGWHAIEFLLWGQDLRAAGPGERSYQDYLPGDPIRERRREYLHLATAMLVDDLATLEKAWDISAKNNYAARFIKMDAKEALGKILTGAATLSGFELASERMAVSLDSGDQEDEHSCFSDNTPNDFIENARSIKNVYLGDVKDHQGPGIDELLAKLNPELNAKILAQLDITEKAMAAIDHPFDQVLATAKDSKQRKEVEAAIASLQKQADLLVEAGKALGVNATIVSE